MNVEVRMVAGQREDEVVRKRDLARRRGQGDVVFGDVGHGRREVRGDLAVLDAVVDVRQRSSTSRGDASPRRGAPALRVAPCRQRSSAAIAAEFLPPITSTSRPK